MSIGGAVASGTANSALFVGAGGVLAQDPASFNWTDTTGILSLSGTSTNKGGILEIVTATNIGFNSGGSFGLSQPFELLSGPDGGTTIPVPTLYPVNANKTIAFDMCPNGTPADVGYGMCWFDLCSNDVIQHGDLATQAIHIGVHSGHHFIGSAEYNSTTIVPLVFGTFNGDTAAETTSFTINADASVAFSCATGSAQLAVDISGNVVMGHAALATSATNGFLYVDTCPGTPTGVPTSYTGRAPMVFNTSTNSLYFYNSGWVPISGGGGSGMAIGGAVTGGTSGSVLFVNASTNLAQNNANLAWDNTNFNLSIDASGTGQGILKIATFNGLYRVANASGDNWFAANAGNLTLTGNQNNGAGHRALEAVTTGSNNTALGYFALRALTTGGDNVAIGDNALLVMTDGGGNVAVGTSAGRSISTGGAQGNFLMGSGAMSGATGAPFYNVIIGSNALANATGAPIANMAFGFSTLGNLGGGPVENTGIGHNALQSITSGDYNTAIGSKAGKDMASGSANTLIGRWYGPSGASLSNAIAICDGTGANTISGVDYNYTSATRWSFQNLTNKIGLHVYNTTDGGAPPTNYERMCLDWNLTSNIARLASQAGGTGTVRLIAIDGFSKAGAPANTDLPSGTWALIDDTSGGSTWLVFNKGGTIRKVQLT
jgi:hypothetical protein